MYSRCRQIGSCVYACARVLVCECSLELRNSPELARWRDGPNTRARARAVVLIIWRQTVRRTPRKQAGERAGLDEVKCYEKGNRYENRMATLSRRASCSSAAAELKCLYKTV